jgi:hypothetical protein
MKQLVALFFIVLLFNSCKKEEEHLSAEVTLPIPDFYFTVATNTDHTISLTLKNLSKDADGYVWYLDNQDSINTFEPTYIIEKNKTYKVTLKAYNRFGSKSVNQFIDIFTIPIIADFSVIINLDSPNIVRFVNNSTNFDKLTWVFGDGAKSSELNPSHEFSSNLDRKVKLKVENNDKQKDSITIVFKYNQWQDYTKCESYLIDPLNFKYVVKKDFTYPGGSHTYSIGPNYTTNQLTFIDSFILVNITSEKTYFIKYYNSNKITSYRKFSTIDLSTFFTDLPNLLGSFAFNNRIQESSLYPPNNYNDTTLTISFSNGLILLEDKKLQHKFTGYLSSFSNNNEYVFKYPDYTIDKTTISQNIVFSRTTDSIVATYNKNWSGFGYSSYNKLTYRGFK